MGVGWEEFEWGFFGGCLNERKMKTIKYYGMELKRYKAMSLLFFKMPLVGTTSLWYRINLKSPPFLKMPLVGTNWARTRVTNLVPAIPQNTSGRNRPQVTIEDPKAIPKISLKKRDFWSLERVIWKWNFFKRVWSRTSILRLVSLAQDQFFALQRIEKWLS